MPEQLFEFSANHPILVLSFFALAGMILFIEFRGFSQKFTSVGPAAAIPIINKDKTVLVDIREMNEVKSGMLADAIHIPMTSIGKRIGELDKFKDQAVIVYCRSGSRSTGVCRKLSSRGFEKVYNLSGGIMAWEDAHLPVIKKRNKK